MTAHKVSPVSLLLLTLSLLPQVAQGVSPATLTLAVSPNPSTLGAPVTLTATVNPTNATGNVTFYDGVTILGTRQLTSGAASLVTRMLPSGTRGLTAYYAGDSSYGPATSNAIGQLVNAAAANAFRRVTLPRLARPLVDDFNIDGIADLTVWFGDDSNNIVLGIGDGTFQSTTIGPPLHVLPRLVADFNLDGKPDLLVSGSTSPLILFGNGDGTFQGGPDVAIGGAIPVTGDFNGDGKPDLALFASGNVVILTGNGDGTFQPGVVTPLGSAGYTGLVSGDFDEDGKTDLAIAASDPYDLMILLGNGDGSFKTPLHNTGVITFGVSVADLNHDGKADLVTALPPNQIIVRLGNGDGTFASPVTYTGDFSCPILGCPPDSPLRAIGDFDGDGNLDIATTTSDAGPQTLSILRGNGDGTFRAPVDYPIGGPSFLISADFNGDGKADLLTGRELLLGVNVSITATDGTPQSALVGTAFPKTLQATVNDTGGNPVSGVIVTFAAPVSGASTIPIGAGLVTNGSGVAALSVSANQTAGNYAVTASVGAVSASFSLINTSIASLTPTGGTPQSTVVGTGFPTPLQATVKDSLNNPVVGATVTFTVVPSVAGAAALLSSATAVTDASGVATVTATANNFPGAYTVTAKIQSFTASFQLTNSPPPASIAAAGGTPQSTKVGTAFAASLQATVRDSQGNPVSGATVTFTVPASGAGATLSSATARTDSSGVATVTATANGIPGAYTVTATYGTPGGFISSPYILFTLTNTAGDPSTMTANLGTPQTAATGAPFASSLQVLVKDSFGNPVSGATVNFQAPASGASATLSSAYRSHQ